MEKIGSLLKDKRVAKRLSPNDINSSTRIPLRYIAALEEDDVSVFPAEVYYLGFLRKYAQFLGLDENALAAAYKKEKADKNAKAAAPQVQKPGSRLSVKFWIAFVSGIAVLTLGAFVWMDHEVKNIYRSIQVVRRPPQISAEKKPAAAKPQPKEAKLRAQAAAVKRPAVTPVRKALELQITAVDASWVKVVADGKPEFSAILEKGSGKGWFADNKFELVIGYAPGVSVKLNGKDIDVRKIAKQDISELTLTAEDAR